LRITYTTTDIPTFYDSQVFVPENLTLALVLSQINLVPHIILESVPTTLYSTTTVRDSSSGIPSHGHHLQTLPLLYTRNVYHTCPHTASRTGPHIADPFQPSVCLDL